MYKTSCVTFSQGLQGHTRSVTPNCHMHITKRCLTRLPCMAYSCAVKCQQVAEELELGKGLRQRLPPRSMQFCLQRLQQSRAAQVPACQGVEMAYSWQAAPCPLSGQSFGTICKPEAAGLQQRLNQAECCNTVANAEGRGQATRAEMKRKKSYDASELWCPSSCGLHE